MATVASTPISVVECQLSSADQLLEWAESEPNRLLLRDYIETIRTLSQDKRFSLREIADWLNARGVPTDHNAVYREYTGWASNPEAYELERERAQMEAEEEEGRTI